MSIPNVLYSFVTRASAEPVDPSVVPLWVSVNTNTEYFAVSLATVLVYHAIIMLDMEVKHLWTNPRSLVSLFFFVNRFIGLYGAICKIFGQSFAQSISSCVYCHIIIDAILTNFPQLQVVLQYDFLVIILIDYILLIRVLALYDQEIRLSIFLKLLLGLDTGFGLDILLIRVLALYHQERKLSVFLKLLLGLDTGFGLGLLIYSGLFDEITVAGLPSVGTACGVLRKPSQTLGIISWAIPLGYGLILLGLALYKTAEHWRMPSGFKGLHLIRVVIQDEIMYYSFVIFCCIMSMLHITILNNNVFLSNLLSSAGSPTLLCVLGGQLLINLKEAGEKGANGGTYNTRTVSDIEFA
ncbi:hypothetical protein A7U60_g3580 [Sanghuangporus baumii]|uniref:DUF6533 domain-containing protein n=1 Tax=Sanghuangporus baumii TaxID=108892 RepID=A0A9Q5NA25_SANBA|nr:hypothetical protein A7U60_g3580 [Sanghuangporus baumii]